MTRIYAILSIAGWTWTVLFGAYLVYRLNQTKQSQQHHENHR